MGREKKTLPGAATAQERHRKTHRDIDWNAPLPPGLVAKNAVPKLKHKTYLEIVDNEDKRKPLEFEKTTQREPPPLFTFVPLGNPELTTLCKDMSRERAAMVYIVSKPTNTNTDLSHQMNRVGYHFRSQIVQQAMHELDLEDMETPDLGPSGVEIIPEIQVDITRQADAALRELFPKIPNTDRAEILAHAFRKGKMSGGEPVVGLQSTLPLSRRVQLAVLAHIRHRHTRYDDLLKETSWANSRKATENACLDHLVKWRGDDETGRDQLDEIIREVVVLSDDESGDDEAGEDSASEMSDDVVIHTSRLATPRLSSSSPTIRSGPRNSAPAQSHKHQALARKKRTTPKLKSKKVLKRERKRQHRNFRRYEAAWDNAILRTRGAQQAAVSSPQPVASGNRRAHAPVQIDHPSQPQVGQSAYAVEARRSDPPQGIPPSQSTARPRYGELPPPDEAVSPVPSLRHAERYTPEYHVHQKVNSAIHVPRLEPPVRGDPRAVHGSHARFQDMLHPSIEQRSPNVPQQGGSGQGRYLDSSSPGTIPADRRYQGHGPARQIVVIREDHAPGTIHQARHPQLYESESYRKHEIPLSQPEMQEPRSMSGQGSSSGRYMTEVYGSHSQSSRTPYLQNGHRQVATHGQMPPQRQPQPQHVMFDSGESIQDRFGPDPDIVEIRRPNPGATTYVDNPTTAPAQEGFVRLRENAPTEQLYRFPQDEGFVRLRESPVMHREPATIQHGYARPREPVPPRLMQVESVPREPPRSHNAYPHRAQPVYVSGGGRSWDPHASQPVEAPPRLVVPPPLPPPYGQPPIDYRAPPQPGYHEHTGVGSRQAPPPPRPPHPSRGHYDIERRHPSHPPFPTDHDTVVIDG